MNLKPIPRNAALAYPAVAGVVALTTLLATPLLGRIDLANIVLFFLLAVVVSAARWGRGPGVFAAFAAVASFDVFFVPPRFSFTVADVQYLFTFVVMLVVSLLISHLTNAYREKALEAERRAGEALLLHELASVLSAALTREVVAERLNVVLAGRLGASASLFLPDADERLVVLRPPGETFDFAETRAVRGVYATGQAIPANRELHDHRLTMLLPLDGSTRRRGVLAIHYPAADEAPEAALGAAIAAVVATAVERLHFVDIAQASLLDAESERLRSAILSAISHDLRTPLTVLYGLADSLAQRAEPASDVRQTAENLRDQSHRLHRMVDNLLDMARLKSGRLALRRDWQSVAELAGASVRGMSLWLGAHRVRLDMAADLPLVEVDAVLFERVFCNLLENAAKYSPPESTITLGAAVDPAAPDWLTVWVDNDGAGFPADRLAQVFDLFERGAAESTVPGVGIGLAVCRAIVGAHGGGIVARNRPGGAEVRFRLPLRAAPAVPPESPESPAAPESHEASIAGRTIDPPAARHD